MEKEQIVKALECCAENVYCDECPNEDEKRCVGKTMRDALFLIREQDKRIEELLDIQAATVRKMHDLIEELCISTEKGGEEKD